MSGFLGIDPGKSGGLALLPLQMEPGSRGAICFPMPADDAELWKLLSELRDKVAFSVLEKVGAMPGQGVTSMFTFGYGFGAVNMGLTAAGIPFQTVLPNRWQRDLGIPPKRKTESKTDFKRRLKSGAHAMFPSIEVTTQTADALLIAEWGRRAYLGLQNQGKTPELHAFNPE